MIANPNTALGDYLKPISSSSFDWIVFLTLSNIVCSRIDLIRISQLQNIGVLTIGPNVEAEESGLDDAIIRSWARVSMASSAFSVLRVLTFRSQKDISQTIFGYLNQFPVLRALNVEGCELGLQDRSHALQYGWEYRTGKTLGDCLIEGDVAGNEWDAVMHALFQSSGQLCAEALPVKGVEAIDTLPRLDLSLGGSPKQAASGVTGNDGLSTFHRVAPSNSQDTASSLYSSQKRPLSQGQYSAAIKLRKRPTVRASKQQSLEGLLMGFAG